MITFTVRAPERFGRVVNARVSEFEGAATALFDQYGVWTMELASDLSPYDTGFMSSNVTYTPIEPGEHWTVGWHRRDFDAAELPFYPPYQEFGTIFHPAQPSLGPAGREMFPLLGQDMGQMMRDYMGGE